MCDSSGFLCFCVCFCARFRISFSFLCIVNFLLKCGFDACIDERKLPHLFCFLRRCITALFPVEVSYHAGGYGREKHDKGNDESIASQTMRMDTVS